MNIVFLDGYTLNPGDLSWTGLQSLGNCTIHDRTSSNEIVERAKNAEILLTNKVPLTKETLSQLPELKYIGITATGYNIVDVQTAREKNIVVTNVKNYGSQTVAQAVFALLFELTNRAGHHSETVRNGRWTNNKDWCYWDFPIVELSGKNFGIIGFGNIGQAVAKIAISFGMNVFVSARDTKTSEVLKTSEVFFVDKETLFKTCDVISLHCTLNDETKHLVNTHSLSLMKPHSYLINTSRGGLVDEVALAKALNNHQIAGAGLDVLSTEPPPKENPLLTAKNCIITPHIAWASQSARGRLMEMVIHNIRSFMGGNPINVVS